MGRWQSARVKGVKESVKERKNDVKRVNREAVKICVRGRRRRKRHEEEEEEGVPAC